MVASPRTPLQKSLSRRVSFNEATLARAHPPNPPSSVGASSDYSDYESQNNAHPRRACGPRFNSCCAWTSLIVGILIILFLLLGGIYFAFLQSNLPQVRLQRLDVWQLMVNTTSAGDTVLTANLEVHLNVTNGSGKIALGYRSMVATVSSGGIDLNAVKLGDMRQAPHATTEMNVSTGAWGMAVEEGAAAELEDNANRQMLVIDVVVKGVIDFLMGGNRMNTLPFKIDCYSIDQTEIDDGHAPKCNTKLTPIQ